LEAKKEKKYRTRGKKLIKNNEKDWEKNWRGKRETKQDCRRQMLADCGWPPQGSDPVNQNDHLWEKMGEQSDTKKNIKKIKAVHWIPLGVTRPNGSWKTYRSCMWKEKIHIGHSNRVWGLGKKTAKEVEKKKKTSGTLWFKESPTCKKMRPKNVEDCRNEGEKIC